MENNQLKDYITAGRQIKTLQQSGMDETERRLFSQRLVSLISNDTSLADLQPMSVFNVALKMYTLGVSPELGTAYIVPYNTRQGKVAQFQMGYKGYVELAMRTGLYNKIDCVEVKKSDYIDYDINTDIYTWRDDKLTYDEVVNRKKEDTIGYRAFVILKDGTKDEMFMTMDEITNHHTEYSQAFKYRTKVGNVFNGASKVAMDRKVVLKLFINRKLVKRMDVGSSQHIREAIKVDSSVIQGEDGNIIAYVDNPKSNTKNNIMKTEPKTFNHKSGAVSVDYKNVDMNLDDITFEKIKEVDDNGVKVKEIEITENNTQAFQASGSSSNESPSEKQINIINTNNLHPNPSLLNKVEASRLIGEFFDKNGF